VQAKSAVTAITFAGFGSLMKVRLAGKWSGLRKSYNKLRRSLATLRLFKKTKNALKKLKKCKKTVKKRFTFKIQFYILKK